jgi:hypothetical protein
MYHIRITNPAAFSATVQAGAGVDTQLFLFKLSALGVSFNDDSPALGTTNSRLTGAFVPAPGEYLLAVSGWDVDAESGAAMEIWNDVPFATERPPDGPGAGGPLAAWAGPPTGGDFYAIQLTGAGFADGPTLIVLPMSVTPGPGVILSGGLAEVQTSDDLRLVERPGPVLTSTTPPAQLTLEGTTPVLSPNQMRIEFEGHASAATISMHTYAFNFSSGLYDEVDVRTLPTTDGTFAADVPIPSLHIGGAGQIRMRFACHATGPVLIYPWLLRVDLARWVLTP